MQFSGKKIPLMFFRTGWAGHFFKKSSTLLFAEPILASNRQRKSTKILVIIYAFLLCVYLHDKVDIFLKHHGFANFPITKGFSFSEPSNWSTAIL
jgi:hypothetical protein